jgi:uncharacterized repeat protein (TIGR03943 family)
VSAAFERYVKAGILAVWGSVALAFVATGRIHSYLHPGFHTWTAAAGVVLVLMAAGLLAFPGGGCGACCGGHGGRTVRSLLVRAAILVVPLLVAAGVSPGQFGVVAVMNRGLAESIVDLPGFQEPPLPAQDGSTGPEEASGFFPPRTKDGHLALTSIDLLYAANEPRMRRDFENQYVEVVGQFFPAHRNNPDGSRFSLIRMMILCCAADARPVAITINAPHHESFPSMSWVKVAGKVTFPIEGGRPVPLIDAGSVAPTEAPRETFLY